MAILEPLQFGIARGLIHVAMDLARRKTRLLQAFGQIAHRGLAIGKNDRGGHVILAQDLAQRVALGACRHAHLELGDIDVRAGRPRHLDIFRVRQEPVGQFLDRRRHRCRKQQRLARGGQFAADRFDIGDEPHVEHAIGFVDHQQFASGQQDLAAFEQIHQASGRGDQHVDAIGQRLDLIAHLDPADQQRHAQIVVLAVLFEVFGNLRGQFAGRFENQRPRHQRATAAMRQNVDHRQHETGGLARAGLRDADDVAHHQHRRDGLRLDRSRLVIAGIKHRLEQFVRQAEIGEFHAKRYSCCGRCGVKFGAAVPDGSARGMAAMPFEHAFEKPAECGFHRSRKPACPARADRHETGLAET